MLTDGALELVGKLHEELDGRRRQLLDARQAAPGRARRGRDARLRRRPRRTSRSRRSPTRCRTGASRSPARPRARWSSTRSTPARAASWPTSRTRTRRTGRNMVGGQVNLADAVRGHMEHSEGGKDYRLDEDHAVLLVRPRGLHLPERHLQVNGGEVAGAFADFGLYVHRNAEALLERGARAVLLHPEARVGPRGGALARRLPDRRARARPRPRDDQGDRPDRDGAGRVRDGRDPVRAARPRRRAQRGPLGLHLLDDQALPVAARLRAARPLRRDDDRAVHARLLGAARADLPRPRRARHGRHVGGDPVAHRRGGEPRGVRGRARRQGARGRRRASTAPGSPIPTPSRSRRRPSTRCSATAPTRSTTSATTCRSAPTTCCRRRRRPARSPRRACASTSTSASSTSRRWLRGNGAAAIYGLMEDAATAEISRGAGLAVDPPRRGARRRPAGHARPGARSWPARSWRRSAREIGDDEWFERAGPARPVARAVRAGGAQRGRVRGVPHAAGLRASC